VAAQPAALAVGCLIRLSADVAPEYDRHGHDPRCHGICSPAGDSVAMFCSAVRRAARADVVRAHSGAAGRIGRLSRIPRFFWMTRDTGVWYGSRTKRFLSELSATEANLGRWRSSRYVEVL